MERKTRLLQPGQVEQSGAPPVIAAGHFSLHQQAQTLFKAQAAHGRLGQLLLQRIAHAAEVRVSAMTINEDGASLSVYKVRDGSVWANFTLPRSSTDVLASNRYPLYRVDKRAPRDLDRERTLPRLVRDYAPAAVREPKWINFRLWIGSTPARSEELIEMMEGSTVVFRYYLFTGGYKETSFALNGSVVGEVLGLRESQSMRSAEEMVRMMRAAKKTCEDNAVRVDFSVCFERAKACSVQASGDPAAFLACNTP